MLGTRLGPSFFYFFNSIRISFTLIFNSRISFFNSIFSVINSSMRSSTFDSITITPIKYFWGIFGVFSPCIFPETLVGVRRLELPASWSRTKVSSLRLFAILRKMLQAIHNLISEIDVKIDVRLWCG